MRVSFKALLGTLFSLFAISGAVNAQIVVSQVYGGGGNTGATLRSDFIELHNNGSTSVNLSTWSVQYASSTGNTWTRTNLTGSIAGGGYFLVKQADGTGGTTNLPTPDSTGTIAMAGTAGKIALVNNQTTLTGSCPLGGAVVDFVGFGAAANCSETAPTAAPSNTTSVIRAGNGCTDTGNNSTDFTTGTPNPRNSASTVQACGASLPLLAVNDVSVFEGDSGTATASFTVSLSAPAGVGGVTFDIATANNSATTADNDYVSKSLTAQSIAQGSDTYTFVVTINGDTTVEAAETYFVNVSNVTGATLSDGQGIGTIQNDDVVVVPISQIQGSGLASPLNSTIVTTEGIVTAQKFNNGFFLQTADANADANPSTSEGIFVFTSTAPPATATVGNRIRVTGTVTEFTPSTNLNQLSITEIVSVTSIQVLSTGNSLPSPIALTSADFAATSTPGTAEKYEGMRVSVASATAVSGADGFITESSATASTSGVFHIILPSVARPFREAGIGILDTFPIPGGKAPPRFDTNQERLMVRTRGQVGSTAIALDAEASLSNLVGVLDYFSGAWAILPDATSPPTVVGGKLAAAVSTPTSSNITIGGFNLLRFFDEVNDSNGAPTLTAAAVDKRLTKTGLAICDYLKAPDIVGVVEVENLRVLGLLADRINATCASAPAYVPYLVQGNDVGGINVGFMVSNRSVGAISRVEVLEVTQFGKTTTLNNPNGSTSLLNDRPPLMLRAIVHHDNGASFAITVIINHLRSLNGIDDVTAGSSGWATESERVRAKRAQQAQFLAQLVEDRQQADPVERIVLLGDFNAFEFNDGYADVMGIVRGDEVPENQVLTYLASPVTAPLIDGSQLVPNPAERYSYVFDGNAQTLDHVVVNEAVVLDTANVVVEHARINADFGVHNFGVAGNAIRVSDHDPVMLYLDVRAFQNVDLGVTVSNPDTSINVGNTSTFTVVVNNNGETQDADNANLSLVLDAAMSGVNVTAPSGWTCAAPVLAAASTTINCSALTFAAAAQASFTVAVPLPLNFPGGDLTLSAAVSAEQGDNVIDNNIASDSVNVIAQTANLAIRARGPSSVNVGLKARINVVVDNYGPDAARNVAVAITTNAPSSAFKMAAPAGWVCSLDSAYPTARFLCSITSASPLAVGNRPEFVLTFTAPASMASTRLIVGTGISSDTADANINNNEDSYSLLVNAVRRIGLPSNPNN
jgi:uncharacterized protein